MAKVLHEKFQHCQNKDGNNWRISGSQSWKCLSDVTTYLDLGILYCIYWQYEAQSNGQENSACSKGGALLRALQDELFVNPLQYSSNTLLSND